MGRPRACLRSALALVCLGMALSTFLAAHPASSETTADVVQGGYSTEPLAAPIFSPEQVATEGARLNNWLIENRATLTPERRQAVLEGLYALVSSHVAHLYAETKRVLPESDDLLLRSLLFWAEPLGAFGAHHVFNSLLARGDEADIEPMPALLEVPDAFSITLDGDTFRLTSARGGWSVVVPYYFMVHTMSEFDTKNGPRTQLVMMSTGAARHEGRPGHSQAAIRLFAGPGQSGGDFARYWLQSLGFDADSSREPFPVGDLRSWKRFDEPTMIQTEMVTWAGANGPLVVYYAGVKGSYEANRVHFVDFVRALRGEPMAGEPPPPR